MMDSDAASAARTVELMYRALSEGDITWFEDRVPARSLHVGPAGRYWMDGETLLRELRRQFAEVDIVWTSGELQVEVRGDVAWASDQPSQAFDDGSVVHCRMSAVLVWSEGSWYLHHSHVSFGVDEAVAADDTPADPPEL